MGVLHAEALQQHLRIAVRHVVAVLVGVKQQVRRLRHVDAAVAQAHAGGEIQAGDEILRLAVAAGLVGVVEDGNAIGALRSTRRRQRHLVVLGAQPLIDFHGFEAGRVRVLEVLDDPHAAAVVERDRHGLADHRLGGDQAHLQVVGDLHALDRLFGGEALGGGRGTAEEEDANAKR